MCWNYFDVITLVSIKLKVLVRFDVWNPYKSLLWFLIPLLWKTEHRIFPLEWGQYFQNVLVHQSRQSSVLDFIVILKKFTYRFERLIFYAGSYNQLSEIATLSCIDLMRYIWMNICTILYFCVFYCLTALKATLIGFVSMN